MHLHSIDERALANARAQLANVDDWHVVLARHAHISLHLVEIALEGVNTAQIEVGIILQQCIMSFNSSCSQSPPSHVF